MKVGPIIVRSGLGGLAVGLEAAGAHLFPDLSPIYKKGCLLNVRPELTLCMLHRETYIVSKLRSLATNITFSHNQTSNRQIKNDLFLGRSISKRTSWDIIRG